MRRIREYDVAVIKGQNIKKSTYTCNHLFTYRKRCHDGKHLCIRVVSRFSLFFDSQYEVVIPRVRDNYCNAGKKLVTVMGPARFRWASSAVLQS
jgi:hypothetical protein